MRLKQEFYRLPFRFDAVGNNCGEATVMLVARVSGWINENWDFAAFGDPPEILDGQRAGESARHRIDDRPLELQQWRQLARPGQASLHARHLVVGRREGAPDVLAALFDGTADVL